MDENILLKDAARFSNYSKSIGVLDINSNLYWSTDYVSFDLVASQVKTFWVNHTTTSLLFVTFKGQVNLVFSVPFFGDKFPLQQESRRQIINLIPSGIRTISIDPACEGNIFQPYSYHERIILIGYNNMGYIVHEKSLFGATKPIEEVQPQIRKVHKQTAWFDTSCI